jgi:hypothetical protein
MDVVENGTYSLWRTYRAWNILMNFIFGHLNGKNYIKEDGARRFTK